MNKLRPIWKWDETLVRDISEIVYKARLETDCAGNTERMLKKDDDGGVKLRNRAASYDALTRVYLTIITNILVRESRNDSTVR